MSRYELYQSDRFQHEQCATWIAGPVAIVHGEENLDTAKTARRRVFENRPGLAVAPFTQEEEEGGDTY